MTEIVIRFQFPLLVSTNYLFFKCFHLINNILLGCFGFRHVFAFMGFLGMICFFIMRVAFSVAIVAMVRPAINAHFNETALKITSTSPLIRPENDTSNLCPIHDEISQPEYYVCV